MTKRFKAASEHVVALDSLFIDAQLEWEGVYTGVYNDSQINARLHKLRKLHHEAECRSLKDGLPVRDDLFRQAQGEAAALFLRTYGVNLLAGGNHVESKRILANENAG